VNRPSYRALIADDEPAARRGVRQLLSAFPQFAVVGECRNGKEALAALELSMPDVLFLDIQMPGIDGFEVIQRRGTKRVPEIVFLTAYDEFAVRAFEAEALDYLVKPVSEERFGVTINLMLRRLQSAAGPSIEEKIVVTTTRGVSVIHASEIDWIQAAGNYAQLWVGERNYFLRESLHQLARRLQQFGFVRAHRKALIRLDAVREVRRTPGGGLVAVVGSGARIPISRRRCAAFSNALKLLGKPEPQP